MIKTDVRNTSESKEFGRENHSKSAQDVHFFISSSKNHFLFLRKTANIISFTTIKIEMPANLMRSRLKMTSEIGQKMASLDLRTALQLLYSFYE